MLRLFCFANLAGGHDLADAHRIDGVRLLDEHVLAGLDARQQVDGVILRRAGDQHHVGAFDHVFVAVQAGKTMGVVHLNLVRLHFLEQFLAGSDVVGKDVAHGHQSCARIGGHGIDGRAGAAVAAADQADADDVAAGRMGAAGQRQRADGRRGQRCLRKSRRLACSGLKDFSCRIMVGF